VDEKITIKNKWESSRQYVFVMKRNNEKKDHDITKTYCLI
jgi:hypothetical protein